MKIEQDHAAAHVADAAAHALHHAAHELHHAAHELGEAKATTSELKPAVDASGSDLAAQTLAASLGKLELAGQELAASLEKLENNPAAQNLTASLGKLEQDLGKLQHDMGKPPSAPVVAGPVTKAPAPPVTPPKVASVAAKTPPARTMLPKAPAPKTHVVEAGDTMWDIARKAGVSLKALEAANPHIANPDVIHPGETIRIPADGHAPAPHEGGGHAAPVGQGGHPHPVAHPHPGGHTAPAGQGEHPHPVGHPHPAGHTAPVEQTGQDGISAHGREEMANLLAHAKENSGGKPALGWCLREVEDILQRTTYGKIGHGVMPRFEYAHQFADYLNAGDRYKSLGLKKLDIHNPYDAPPGAIVVVRAGTPGTRNPVAGDISIAAGGGRFLNDGEMGYGGPGGFPRGNSFVLGVYVPA